MEKVKNACASGGHQTSSSFAMNRKAYSTKQEKRYKGSRHLQPGGFQPVLGTSTARAACGRKMPINSRNMAAKKQDLADMVVVWCRLLEPEFQNRNDL